MNGRPHPSLSVVIPAHNEERYIATCLVSIHESAELAETSPEIVVVQNRCTDRTGEIAASYGARCITDDRRCIAAIRNTGVKATTGECVLTIDADSWMTPRSIPDALEHLADERFIGGGTATVPERFSVGIAFSLLAIAPYLIGRGVSGGMFWFRRPDFDQLGGFDESLLSLEDLDFGRRLKALGRARGQRYGTLRRGKIKTSCRKFDQFGDWYLFRNPRLVRRLFSGKHRQAADEFYYDTDR